MSGNRLASCPLDLVRVLVAGWMAVLILAVALNSEAAVWDPFSGFIDLSAIQAQVDDLEQETLRQEYNLTFDQSLAPWVDLRLAARYYKFDQELELLLGGYREEFQPSGELRWNHDLFNFTTRAVRRELTTSARGKIINRDFQTSLTSVDERYPIVQLRFDRHYTESPEVDQALDIEDSRFQAVADYRTEHHGFNYSYSYSQSENVISTLTSDRNRHLFRWDGAGNALENQRLQLNGRVTYNYATQTNESSIGGPILEQAPIAIGLYALDFDPDLGALDPRPTLADGNKVDPVVPQIDIGAGGNGHNLGADLGFIQAVAGMYVYTDRPSGSQVRWEVFGSQDNITWQLIGTPLQFFNPALNRYELNFPAASHRYVKAVNSGLNEIALVYITEIEVLRELPPETDSKNFASSSTSMDGRAGYLINDRWSTSLDASLQIDENIGRAGDRSRWGLGWRTLFDQSKKLDHHFRVDLSKQGGESLEPTISDFGVGYTMMFDPMETIRGSFSLSDRVNFINGAKNQNILNGVLEGSTKVLPDLDLALGTGVSWFDDFTVSREYSSWYVRGGIDAGILPSMDLTLDYNYQETDEVGVSQIRLRRFASLGLDWRVTRDIYARASIRSSNQVFEQLVKDYLVSWNMLPSLRVSFVLFEIVEDGVITTLRKSGLLNWDLTNRSTLYFRVAEVDYSGTGGIRTVSFQQGFRLSF